MRMALAFCLLATGAQAQSFTAGIEVGTERTAEDFSKPLLNYDLLSLTRGLDGGASWTVQVQNYRASRHGPVTWAAEGLIGYRRAVSAAVSLYGNVGGGERLSPTRDFPYLALRLGADDELGGGLTWNTLNFRYRTGWDKRFPYHSTTFGSGLSYRFAERFAVYSRVFAVFDTNYDFSATGIGVGLRTFF